MVLSPVKVRMWLRGCSILYLSLLRDPSKFRENARCF